MSVLVLRLPGRVGVLDSADPAGDVLRFTLDEWAEFVASVKQHPLNVVPPASTGRLSFPDGRLNLPPLPRRLPPPYIDP